MRVKNQLLIQQQQQQLIQQNQRLEQEIVERLKAEAEVRQMSLTDALTGLYNRRGFFLLAEQQLKLARRNQSPYYLLFADLDGLKQINDSLGHEKGDEVIVGAAEILKQTFRDADIVARLGGDEFVILIPTCSDKTIDFHLRLQTSLDRFNQESDAPYCLAISMGVQFCALSDDVSLESLLAQADKLMYDQKRLKSDKVRLTGKSSTIV
jgi:diguanylate cyclase (GGDEF)-like protein